MKKNNHSLSSLKIIFVLIISWSFVLAVSKVVKAHSQLAWLQQHNIQTLSLDKPMDYANDVRDSESKPPPNIIVLLADDLAYGDLGSYGNTEVKTPNIDRLAEEGMKFTDFHADAAYCSPTRASLLTGRYPQRTGVHNVGGILNDDEVTIAQRLRDEAGYATAALGKWHLGGQNQSLEFPTKRNPIHYGFQEFRGFMGGFTDYITQRDEFSRLDWWHNDQLVQEPGYTTHLLTEHALRFIEKYRYKEKPFFLYIAFAAVHFPFMTPEDSPHYITGNHGAESLGDPTISRLGPHDGSDRIQDVLHRMISELDTAVGRIVERVKQLGISENTMVFFLSDDGGYIQYGGHNRGKMGNMGPLRGQKTTVWEGGHRVPAIAWWPGHIPAGTSSDETIMTHDLHPTFLELAGLKSPSSESANALDGISLLPLLLSNGGWSLPERTLFWEYQGDRAVRYGDWKLVWQGRRVDEDPKLFNLANDIGETNDLAAKHPDLVNKLLDLLEDWEEDVWGRVER